MENRIHKIRYHQKGFTDGSKHMQTCSASLDIREMQVKNTMRYYYKPIRMGKIEMVTAQNDHKDVDMLDH